MSRPVVPRWFDNMAWPYQQAFGWFYFRNDTRYAIIGKPKPKMQWLALPMLLILPIVFLHLIITAICFGVISRQRNSSSGTQKSSRGNGYQSASIVPTAAPPPEPDVSLRVSDFEWWVAEKRAEWLEDQIRQGAILEPSKLSRREIAYWEMMARRYINEVMGLNASSAEGIAMKDALLSSRVGRTFGRSEQFRTTDPLLVHSFEFLRNADGALVPYATAVHRTVGTGGFSRIKQMQSRDGDVKTKKISIIEPAALPRQDIRSNFLIMRHLGLANTLLFRRASIVQAGREKSVIFGKMMLMDLRHYFQRFEQADYATNPTRLKLRANPLRLLTLLSPVLDQLSFLHRPDTAPDGGDSNEFPPGRYIHLDVKPQNILVREINGGNDLELVLMDFDGLLHVDSGHEDIQFERDGRKRIISSPNYQPPELDAANHHAKACVGTYSDIYSLGVSLEKLARSCQFNMGRNQLQRDILFSIVNLMKRPDFENRPSADELLEWVHDIEAALTQPTQGEVNAQLRALQIQVARCSLGSTAPSAALRP